MIDLYYCHYRLDVTDIPAGNYTLRVRLNLERKFDELSFENNDYAIPVTVPSFTLNTEPTGTNTVSNSATEDPIPSAAPSLILSFSAVALLFLFVALVVPSIVV